MSKKVKQAKHFVYRCFDSDGRLLYIGRTTDVKRRMSHHKAVSDWFPMCSRVEAGDAISSYYDSILAERHAIADEVPLFNKTGHEWDKKVLPKIAWLPSQYAPLIKTRWPHEFPYVI
jgi:hypothetical protein